MLSIHFTTRLKDGSFIDDKGNISNLLNNFGNDMVRVTVERIRPPKTEKEWSNHYFLIRDEFLKGCSPGYTKKEFHDILKKKFALKVYSKPENINASPSTKQTIIEICTKGDVGDQLKTTQYFSVKGWEVYIDMIKEFLKDEFNFFI